MKRFLKFSILFILVVVLLYLFMFQYIRNHEIEDHLDYLKFSGSRINALVVFFGGFRVDGNPNGESMRRLQLAMLLYEKRIGENIIFVGGWRPSKNQCGSRMMALEAIGLGLNPSHVFYDISSRDTIQNWREAEKIISKNSFKRIILISSIFHLIRIQHLIKINRDIESFSICYNEANAIPSKSICESFCDYNYNMISYAAYMILPYSIYQEIIEEIRK